MQDNIKMHLIEIGYTDSFGSGQGPVAECCEHGNEPWGSIKGLFWTAERLSASQGLCYMQLVG
jgi:hypothetical protein